MFIYHLPLDRTVRTDPAEKHVPTGIELGQPSNSPKKRRKLSTAISTDLSWLVAAWPKLPEAIRRAIISLIDAARTLARVMVISLAGNGS
jgi:hypothetical protein